MNQKLSLSMSKSTHLLLDINDIIYFEKCNKFIKVILKGKKNIYIKSTMKNLQKILKEKNLCGLYFMRSHCSYIVNISNIKIININEIEMINNAQIPISYSYQKEFYKAIDALFTKII